MTNLLAMLVSLAMLLTGTSTAALPEAPVGRVMTIGNLVVSHNDEDTAPDVYATLGTATDGTQALYDFSVSDNESVYFPFQLVATADRLLLRNDRHGHTLKLTAEELAAMVGATLGDDAESAAINAWLPAYMDLLGVMADKAEMEALRDRGFEIYDEMVDRGEGVPGKAEYEGETYDVNTYEYALTGAQLGALADAIYASSDRLKGFPEAYFKLLAQLPDELGLSGATSYEALLDKLDIGMRVTESIADDGPVLMDATLTMTQPNDGPTISYVIHQARFEDDEYSTVAFDMPADALVLSVYVEYSRYGGDPRYSINITGNPEAAEAGEDGEGDGEDALYITLDSDTRYADNGMVERDITATIYALNGYHGEFSVESEHDGEGIGFSHVDGSATIRDESYAASFDVVVTNEVLEARVTDEDAESMGAFDLLTLLSAMQADADQLGASADIQALTNIIRQPDAEPDDDDEPAANGEAEDSDLPFAHPRFDWLPEGYAVEDISVDTQYDDVSCTLVNADTGGVIIVDLSNSSYVENAMHYYVVKDDGFKAVEGLLIAEEDNDDYYLYTADDGQISYTIYPDSKDVTTTDVLNLIIGLHF